MSDRLRLFIGRYTDGDTSARPAPGITVAEFDPDALTITALAGAARPEASFLVLSRDSKVLYAASETDPGQVAAFTVPDLTPVGVRPTHGSLPCYLSIDPTGRYLLVANYGSGGVTVLPIGADGALDGPSHVAQHEGSGPEVERQAEPHAHMVQPTPDGTAVLAVDLGGDSVYTYTLDAGVLTVLRRNAMRPGSGPRHLVFHATGAHFYLANELSNSVAVCAYDATTGSVTTLTEVPAAPHPGGGRNYPGGIVLSRDHRFVYVSNRGDESVGGYEIVDGGAGLRPIGRWPCGGSWPRHITLSPDGAFLFSANQRAHSVAVHRVDRRSGTLTATGLTLPVHQVAQVLIGQASSGTANASISTKARAKRHDT